MDDEVNCSRCKTTPKKNVANLTLSVPRSLKTQHSFDSILSVRANWN